MFNSPIKEITLNINSKDQIKILENCLDKKGETIVNISLSNNLETHKFKLKKTRNIDRKSINILRNKEIELKIH